MEDFFTGAIISKTDNGYSVEFRNQIVAEYEMKDLAIILALDRSRLENLYKTTQPSS